MFTVIAICVGCSIIMRLILISSGNAGYGRWVLATIMAFVLTLGIAAALNIPPKDVDDASGLAFCVAAALTLNKKHKGGKRLLSPYYREAFPNLTRSVLVDIERTDDGFLYTYALGPDHITKDHCWKLLLHSNNAYITWTMIRERMDLYGISIETIRQTGVTDLGIGSAQIVRFSENDHREYGASLEIWNHMMTQAIDKAQSMRNQTKIGHHAP